MRKDLNVFHSDPGLINCSKKLSEHLNHSSDLDQCFIQVENLY